MRCHSPASLDCCPRHWLNVLRRELSEIELEHATFHGADEGGEGGHCSFMTLSSTMPTETWNVDLYRAEMLRARPSQPTRPHTHSTPPTTTHLFQLLMMRVRAACAEPYVAT